VAANGLSSSSGRSGDLIVLLGITSELRKTLFLRMPSRLAA